jgi:hypothetical protein
MNIIDIQLLNEVFDTSPRDLSINLFPKQLTNEKIDYLHEVISKYPGSQKLTINLIDTDEPDLSIPSLSKSVAIKPNPEMIKELEKMKVRFKLV